MKISVLKERLAQTDVDDNDEVWIGSLSGAAEAARIMNFSFGPNEPKRFLIVSEI